VRRGAGRPPKSPEERLDHRVMVNLTPREFTALEKAAGVQSLGAYVRDVLVRHLFRRKH